MKIIAALIVACSLSACSFMIKTPTVANYNNLEKIDNQTTRNDVAVLLGTPQGTGNYIYGKSTEELQFYYGFAGEFTMSGATYDSGTAFISYKENKPSEVIYFTSKATGRPIVFSKALSIKAISNTLQLGKTKIEDAYRILGQPDYAGKRINFETGIDHKLAMWEASELQSKGAMKEKWLLIGYDNSQIVQDLIWVSSKAEDIQEFGSVTEQQMMQMSRQTVAGFLPVLEPTALNTGTKIDPVQVDALIKTSPKNVKEIIKVLGLPSALGIKSFAGNEPMSLSNWSFSTVEMKGKEHNFIPPGATEEQRAKLQESSFMVMDIEQSRLMVGHTRDGEIKEILWTRPLKQ